MVRMPPLLTTIVGATAMFAGVTASTAFAQAPGGYRAVPAKPMQTAQNVIVGEILWKCGPDGCSATNSGARPAIVCAQAAKKVGKLDSFVADNVAFDAEALAKCNAKAKA